MYPFWILHVDGYWKTSTYCIACHMVRYIPFFFLTEYYKVIPRLPDMLKWSQFFKTLQHTFWNNYFHDFYFFSPVRNHRVLNVIDNDTNWTMAIFHWILVPKWAIYDSFFASLYSSIKTAFWDWSAIIAKNLTIY